MIKLKRGSSVGTSSLILFVILVFALSACSSPAGSKTGTYNLGDTGPGGGKNDWFLPSRDELALIWTNKDTNDIGAKLNMQIGYHYWSSSQAINSDAWGQLFDSGDQGYNDKANTNLVRAIRAF